ncbi:MAG: MATE family efflux transporter [Candidatus Cryptobacteroides sp.]
MAEDTEIKESRTGAVPTELGTEKIWKLLKGYALPAIIAMTASSLYNMVDSIFVGQGVGPLAISGLAVTFPLMNLSTAFGTLVGVGGSTLLSILLGQKNYVGVRKVLSNIITLNIIIGLVFSVTALLFLDPILYFFGASDNTIPYARDYMRIILIGNVITHVYFGLNSAMRATGNPKKAMGLTIFTVLFNTALDPLLIFGLDMGIRGAAWATVIAQALAMIIVVLHFHRKDKEIRFNTGVINLDRRIARDSLEIGFGPFLMNAASCVVALFINQQMGKYAGDMGIGAYGICNRFTFLFVMISMGLNQGMQPIAGYNYGARLYSRLKEVYLKTALLATIVSVLCFVVCVFFPRTACSIFTHDEQLLEMSSKGLRIMNIVFPIVGFQMVGTNLFQCLGMVSRSIFLSLSRQLLCLVPLIYLLPLFFGAEGVWLSFPLSDFIASILTVIMLGRLFSKFNKVKDGDAPELIGGKF